jgi:Fur family ferric uptake transcriptional regulator
VLALGDTAVPVYWRTVRAIMRTAETILETMHQRGWRVTGPRRAIVEYVLAQDGPFSAEEIFRALRRRQPAIGRATVFRTLDLLAELGVVERIHHPSGVHRYVVGGDGHRHHVVCIRCGAVAEFAGCNLETVLAQVADQTRFRILGHWLEVSGLCQLCQREPAVSSS